MIVEGFAEYCWLKTNFMLLLGVNPTMDTIPTPEVSVRLIMDVYKSIRLQSAAIKSGQFSCLHVLVFINTSVSSYSQMMLDLKKVFFYLI